MSGEMIMGQVSPTSKTDRSKKGKREYKRKRLQEFGGKEWQGKGSSPWKSLGRGNMLKIHCMKSQEINGNTV